MSESPIDDGLNALFRIREALEQEIKHTNATHTNIARELVRLGVNLPASLGCDCSATSSQSTCFKCMNPDVREAMLIGVMAVDACLDRHHGWWMAESLGCGMVAFEDEDYSDSHLLSCFAAFKEAKGAT